MVETKDAQQILQENINHLGDTLGRTYTYASNEFMNTLLAWNLYRGIYGTNQERVELINNSSWLTSLIIERSLFEMTLLKMRSLTVSVRGKGESAEVCLSKLVLFSNEEHKEELGILLGQSQDACRFAKNWSDKKIAHTDWKIKTGSRHLKSASREKIEHGLRSIAKVLQRFSILHLNATPIYSFSGSGTLEPTNFLNILRLGVGRQDTFDQEFQLALDKSDHSECNRILTESEWPEWLHEDSKPNWRNQELD